MRSGGQSSIEFITIYGFAFMIIALVLALVFTISAIPKTVLPSQCTIYGSLDCVDSIYIYNSVTQPRLFIEAYDTQPGTLNISSFSAVLNTRSSASGYCTPQVITQGQTTYCIATFNSISSFAATIGITYSGTIQLKGNYCTPSNGLGAIGPCSAASQPYTYGGYVSTYGTYGSNIPIIYGGAPGSPPITFTIAGYGGASSSYSVSNTLASGASLYLCNGADGNSGLTATSWAPDAISPSAYSGAGHQTADACSDTSGSTDIVVGGVAINTNIPYSVQTYSLSGGSFSTSSTYTLSGTSNVIISIACGNYKCNSINVPPTCSQLFYIGGSDNYETSYAAECINQDAGTYLINGSAPGGAGIVIAVYKFSPSAPAPTAAQFNGASSYIYRSTPATTSQIQSSSAWIYTPDPSGTNLYILDQGGNNNWMQVYNDGIDGGTSVGGGYCGTSSDLSPNTWYFVTHVYNGVTNFIYINGALGTSCSATGVTPTSLTIGEYGGGGYYFDGQMADVQIYDTALSSGQITTLYDEGFGGKPIASSGNVGWWPLNGTANDYSGNGNNGVGYNINYVVSSP
jgi:hypothetical protein